MLTLPGRCTLAAAGRAIARSHAAPNLSSWAGAPAPPMPAAPAALPVLSVAEWRLGGPEGRARFAAQLQGACESTGFVYLRDHGCEAMLAESTAELRRFFALPPAAKEQVAYERSPVYPLTSRGWQAGEWLDPARKGMGDTKESFEIGHEAPLPEPPESAPFLGPNLWPSGSLPELQPKLTEAFEALHGLSLELCRAFAFSVGAADEEVFAKACSGSPMVLARGLYYPEATGNPDEIGCSAHTDYGVLSLLHQTGPGLQVLRADGKRWLDVPPLEGCLVCNIADLMERWTNGRYVSSVHRVIVPPGAPARYTFAFFLDAVYGTRVEPLAECCGEGRPARYDAVSAGEHKLSKTRIQYGQDVEDASELFARTFVSASASPAATASA